MAGARQRLFIFLKKVLCREPYWLALGKDYLFVYLEKIFAECLTCWLSAKNIYLFF